jgi:hypothetical protein
MASDQVRPLLCLRTISRERRGHHDRGEKVRLGSKAPQHRSPPTLLQRPLFNRGHLRKDTRYPKRPPRGQYSPTLGSKTPFYKHNLINMKELKDYSEVDLKALAYDQLATIEQAQNNLKLIHQELGRRRSQPETDAKNTDKTA